MAERLKARAWKVRIRPKTVSWVRIPLPPPLTSESVREIADFERAGSATRVHIHVRIWAALGTTSGGFRHSLLPLRLLSGDNDAIIHQCRRQRAYRAIRRRRTHGPGLPIVRLMTCIAVCS